MVSIGFYLDVGMYIYQCVYLEIYWYIKLCF